MQTFRAPHGEEGTLRVITEREEAEELNKELLEIPFAVADSEWYNHDRKRHQVNNGLSMCWTICWRDSDGRLQNVYLHNYGKSAGNLFALKPWFTSPEHKKGGHNTPVDWHVLANEGIRGVEFNVDTLVADFLYDENRENRHGLKQCAEDHLGHYRKGFRETFGTARLRNDGKPYASGEMVVPTLDVFVNEWKEETGEEIPQVLIDYATEDSLDTWLLYEFYKPILQAKPWGSGTYWDYFWDVECRLTDIITRMEHRGMYLDTEFLRDQLLICNEDMEKLEAQIVEWAGVPFNINSDPQLGHLLFGKGRKTITKGKRILYHIEGLGLPIQGTTDSGAPSTDAISMKKLLKWVKKERPEYENGIQFIAEYSRIGTQRGTFLEGLYNRSRRHRIHTRWNQTGTTSGRGSSSGPNLQNITTGDKDKYHIRDAFCAPPGMVLIVSDFAQLEYRLLAHFTQDPKLLDAFRKNLDLHSLTAYNIYPHIKKEVDERFKGVVGS